MFDLKQIMLQGKFSFYGYSYACLPKLMQEHSDERVEIFFKRKGQKIRLTDQDSWNYYSGYQDTPWGAKDIVFFDQDATKSLCVGFPGKSKYVMVSLKYPRFYFFILIGLIRRLLSKSISIKGFVNLDNGSVFSPWILLKCKELPTNSLTLNKEIGISGFLDFLSIQKVRYLVPRFYENLPDLLKHDADLDIVVDSKDADKVKKYLLDNPGEIPIDVYTDKGTDYHGMSYLPPSKAKNALDRAIKGPGKSLIPCQQDALDLIIYHALYHKGYLSRIKSSKNLNQKNYSDNKYLNVIEPLTKDLNLKVGSTLEEMDYYMEQIGWKPAIDTLAKIAQWNEWVRDYHMSKKMIFVPLYVFILKEGLRESNLEDLVKKKCEEEGLKILEESELIGDIREKAISDLRGGIWNDSLKNPDDVEHFYPYKILVLWDTLGRQIGGIAEAKERVRLLVDNQKTSLVHSSDNYIESLDYIDICIPNKSSFYHDKELVMQNFNKFTLKRSSIKKRLNDFIAKIKKEFRAFILSLLSH
tara:strand:- start:10712 stop:12289 length:1578 start_codon:yes stop_codon:yes gene_type:complete